jgi:glutaredoxin
VLDQLGLAVEQRDTRTHPEHRQALREKTGRTQVPCLFIDGEPMFESADIIEWLEAYALRT